MKYLFLLFSFVSSFGSIYGQSLIYIDFNYDSLEESIEEGAYIHSEDYITLSDGEKLKTVKINTYSNKSYAVLYFDSKGVCVGNGIHFNDGRELNKTIEVYNKAFVIVNSTSWKTYNKGAVYLAELLVADNGTYFIFWSRFIN